MEKKNFGKLFWLCGFAVTGLWLLIDFIVTFFIPVNNPIALLLTSFKWLLWYGNSVSVWLCAFNASNRIWGYIARMLIALEAFVFIITFFLEIVAKLLLF